MEIKNYVIAALAILFVVAAVFAIAGNVNKITVDESNKLVNDAVIDKMVELTDEFDAEKLSYESTISNLTGDKAALETEKAALENEVTSLEKEVADYQSVEIPVEDGVNFVIDDVPLTGDFKTTIDSDDFDGLVSGDFTYDGDRFDYEEVIYLSEDFKPFLNVDDFNGNIAVGIEEDGAITYMIEFDDKLDLDDEDLEINFLGLPMSLVSFDGNELEYRTSELFTGKTGDTFTYDGYDIEIVGIDSDNEKAMFAVNGVERSIVEENERTINGLEIYVEEIFLNNVRFYAGDEVVENIGSGDEYEANDDWSWVINGDGDGIESIGITLTETLADDDEVLAEGDSISLPNDYVTFTFEKVKNMELYDVELKVSNTKLKVSFDDVIEIDGDKIDDAEFVVDLETLVFEFEYKGDDKEGTDFGLITFFADDRELGFGMSADVVRIGLNDATGYRFNYVDGEFISSFDGAVDMNEDEDFRMGNGDLLYKSEVNEEDGDDSVKVGLVGDDDVEVLLRVE